MSKVLSSTIKLMLVFHFTTYILYYLRVFIGLWGPEINIITVLFNAIVPFIIFIILIYFIWINSNKISEKIIGNNNEGYIININHKEILSIAIIVLAIYLLIYNFGIILDNIVYILSHKINYILNYDYYQNIKDMHEHFSYLNYSHYISPIISRSTNIIISLFLLIFRRKIIKCFEVV